MNQTLQIIKARRSTRSFKTEQIKEEELQAILEAGYFAPSANNKQPWHFTVVQNQNIIDELSADFKVLAQHSESPYLQKVGNNERFHVFYHAPTIILLSGEENNPSSAVDCAAATQNMLIQAESLGIGSCWVGFIAYLLNSPEGKSYLGRLGIPEGYKEIHSIALGYKKVKGTQAPQRKPDIVNYLR